MKETACGKSTNENVVAGYPLKNVQMLEEHTGSNYSYNGQELFYSVTQQLLCLVHRQWRTALLFTMSPLSPILFPNEIGLPRNVNLGLFLDRLFPFR